MYQHLDQEGFVLPYANGKVVCVGRSYRDHAEELNNPVPESPLLFIKPATSLTPLSEPLVLPAEAGPVHHEAEVALLIGRRLCKADAGTALAGVAGVGLALDLTLRALQDELKAKGHPWERAKAFDGSCPMGPFLAPELLSPLQQLDFSLMVNGELRQSGNTGLMMWSMGELLADISHSFTLMPGDIVLTGTPKGVGELNPGDALTLTLDNKFAFEAKVAK
ncbi:fumarylacetoacetate hydrolase family protein [Oceanimonas baumannii]|uniref:2-keto-4-pentenoate hydratase/2-oxohepta-3-ene-1,7-dioic acid hydratase in catechol pathway n=1 Tax=Oceanimonas baumannii TaxID=129578 RepID=A0A235CH36_9GAMM|nr:fumarylacetoacetate hydrolase family protein [Oceanimonas baumannii]OYD23872.1 isomerase/hydrolase [Oceanimonas baumannii]TDW58800.1 2-keto-4-pentenoate hydratase/2-oxohepta-3-ene-1,7-dioic acid hydratase in catechol pathway [Oceanimonas baumannii]